jgi:hypothetical protein
LKVASALISTGSGCFSLMVMVSGALTVTLSTDASRKPQMPFLGLAARSSDHFTSSAVIGVLSANLTPWRSVIV